MKRWLFVAALLAAVASAVVLSRTWTGSDDVDARAQRISAGLRCPTCEGVSVADSPTPIARDLHARVVAEVRAGRSADEIRGGLVAAYGDWILLSPPTRGVGWLPWALPVLVAVAGCLFWGAALRRPVDVPRGSGAALRDHPDGTGEVGP